jgi:hypothetical protein
VSVPRFLADEDLRRRVPLALPVRLRVPLALPGKASGTQIKTRGPCHLAVPSIFAAQSQPVSLMDNRSPVPPGRTYGSVERSEATPDATEPCTHFEPGPLAFH